MRLNFSLEVLLAFVEAGLILTERSFEVKVMIELYKSGDMWWFWLTLIFIWLPGVIFVGMTAISAIKFGCTANLLKEGVKYGLMFPFSTIYR